MVEGQEGEDSRVLRGITISNVIFDDGTFEGDPNVAAHFLARVEGVRIQAPQGLLKIEQTLTVDDNEFQAACDRLEKITSGQR